MNSEYTEDQQKQQEDRADDANKDTEHEALATEGFAAPGVPIVRSSSPRPLAYGLIGSSSSESSGSSESSQSRPQLEAAAAFPVEAPAAPPLPEEYNAAEEDTLSPVATPLPGRVESPEEASSEFIWLFEYGLEMDVTVLNSAERLHDRALLYGMAVLRGYEVVFEAPGSRTGQAVATIVASSKPDAEVWGVLYRIPRRLTESTGSELAYLDKIHDAAPPDGLFERLSIMVHEVYRGREVACITYAASATARKLFQALTRDRQVVDEAYIQQLIETAKKHKLPERYLQALAVRAVPADNVKPLVTTATSEQNTEPLPVFGQAQNIVTPVPSSDKTPPSSRHVAMVIFAVYLLFSLLMVFMLAILQALGNGTYLFPANFTPLDIPWFVLVYGYIGGCLSCIVRLAWYHTICPPRFVVITWFTRPLIGVILAIMAFLLVNSGLFILGGDPEQHKTLYSLLAILAGSCEGWLFYRKK
jgi:cation transport regulator ChaC